MNQPLATIVVTPRERFSTALRCLPNIIANTSTPHHLIYVAGNPPPYVADFLKTTCGERGYDLVLKPEFLAPNAARNIGLQLATTKYVVFVDNDVVVEPGWLDALLSCAEETGADVVGPICLYGEPEAGLVHTAGGDFSVHEEGGRRWLEETHRHPNVDLKVKAIELERSRCDFVEFHCMLTRRSLFDDIGPLDEQIISAAEHLDVALLVREHGGKTYSEPGAVVSYLADADFVLSDAGFFTQRWSDEWYKPSIDHFARKWRLDRDTDFFRDYDSFTWRQQEHCRLPKLAGQAGAGLRARAQTVLQLADQVAQAGNPPWNVEAVLDAYRVASVLYSGVYRETGKTLISHGVGAASGLAAYGAPTTVIIAGLLHAAYMLGRFPPAIGDDLDAARRWLARKIGPRAEAQVYDYFRLDFEKARSLILDADPDRLPLTGAYSILMRIANSIDEYADDGFLYTHDPASAIELSGQQNEQWSGVYAEVAVLLRCPAMLEEMLALHRGVAAKRLPFRPPPPAAVSNHLFDETGEPQPAGVLWAQKATRIGSGPLQDSGEVSLFERLRTKAGARLHRFGARHLAAQNGAAVRTTRGLSTSTKLTTGPQQWSYACTLPVDPDDAFQGEVILRVKLSVSEGELGVGVLCRDGSDEFLVAEQSVAPANQPVELLFRIPEVKEAGALVFRGWSPAPSKARIFEIELHSPRPR